jgi:hypothetical protein
LSFSASPAVAWSGPPDDATMASVGPDDPEDDEFEPHPNAAMQAVVAANVPSFMRVLQTKMLQNVKSLAFPIPSKRADPIGVL